MFYYWFYVSILFPIWLFLALFDTIKIYNNLTVGCTDQGKRIDARNMDLLL